MKKLFLLLSILLSVGILVSCSDDVEHNSDNSITVTFDNVAVVDGVIYATQVYPLEIESMVLSSSDGSAKSISEAQYSIDTEKSETAHFKPFSGRIETTGLTEGNHTLELSFDLLQNDNTTIPDDILYSIVIVKSIDDIPNGYELGNLTRTFRSTHS